MKIDSPPVEFEVLEGAEIYNSRYGSIANKKPVNKMW